MALRRITLLLFVPSLIWILGFSVYQVRYDFQQDFNCFYSAGLSLSEGLSPYDNNKDRDPRTWDGHTQAYSGFLYTPLAARAFVPFARLDYGRAKALWTILMLAFLAAALVLATALFWPGAGLKGHLLVQALSWLYFPVLLQIHSGNVDTVTLLLITAGFAAALRRPGGTLGAALFGAGLAAAAGLKPDCLLFVPALAAGRLKAGATGFVVSFLLLAGLSLAWDGPALSRNYFFDRLPWISQGRYEQPEFPDRIPKDGVDYKIGFKGFLEVASGTRVLVGHLPGSLRFAVLALTPLALWAAFFWLARGLDGADRLRAALLFGLALCPFCAPLAWTQRLVWLLPWVPWGLKRLASPGPRFALGLVLACFVMTCLPAPQAKGWGAYNCLALLGMMAALLPAWSGTSRAQVRERLA